MKRNMNKVEEKPCACEVHVRLEASDGKDHLKCLGHGIGCPCTAKMEEAKQATENAEVVQEPKPQA